MKNIAQAILNVMESVKGIDKSMTVGTGNFSYKGVPDQEVKKIIGEAMRVNGLCLLPIGVDAKVEVDNWQEGDKRKQSVFTEVNTKYMLLHSSGESIELQGYGQGVDSQDKSAGKATTYALKYTLLYLFLVPTGKIDDSDATHSEDSEVPKKEYAKKEYPKNDTPKKAWLNKFKKDTEIKTVEWEKTVSWILDVQDLMEFDKKIRTIEEKYIISKANLQELKDMKP